MGFPEIDMDPHALAALAAQQQMTPYQASRALAKLLAMHQAYVKRRTARGRATPTDQALIDAMPALGLSILVMSGYPAPEAAQPAPRRSYPHLRLTRVATGQIVSETPGEHDPALIPPSERSEDES